MKSKRKKFSSSTSNLKNSIGFPNVGHIDQAIVESLWSKIEGVILLAVIVPAFLDFLDIGDFFMVGEKISEIGKGADHSTNIL